MNKYTCNALTEVTAFLGSIGLETVAGTTEGDTFLPGIFVRQGSLYYDPDKLLYPGDLLHEAGHLAILPPEQRNTAAGDFAGDGGSEMGAIAWSYAACTHIGLPIEVLFHENGYKGDARWLAETFEAGNYIGLPILQWLGMATTDGENAYPGMLHWLHPGNQEIESPASS